MSELNQTRATAEIKQNRALLRVLVAAGCFVHQQRKQLLELQGWEPEYGAGLIP